MAEKPKHLDPSELGTREYWDKLYTTEIANHAANPDDIGTVWFDDSDAESKMLAFLDRLAGNIPDSGSEASSSSDPESSSSPQTVTATSLCKESASIVDLGCGNGSILFALRARGWLGPLAGVDYSAHSIRLASQIAAAASTQEPPSSFAIRFVECDLLHGPPLSSLLPAPNTFDVVLDKGTFDAISLSDATDDRDRRACEGYRARVLPLLPVGGLFLITSCNWTEDELRGWFVGGEGVDGAVFEEAGRVKYRSFSFGGVSGQTISTLCFRKVSSQASSSR
ncbi:hypothetical protein ISF_06581 [Cordyceps fumosorosea ARSEF 2679]|uniref:Protein-lysine N-methyltransferase EFM4 n=1 Tax=Cordyceps fumosorosea (strain ARSEF 2679) TaxID=1081104 RepID=A0A167RPF1_CORFA|nr:hypothetical protein ISF_06581 [Cordyceps fumosorosea ARSEF 2679]OAA58798.1 hypothetical protein ISF_06581 [Cordyceps fumosorosea ARSEF 2679]